MNSQDDLDVAYGNLCSLIKDEMHSKADFKHVKIECSTSNKKRKLRKPWWITELTEAWNTMCEHEKKWLSCKNLHQKSSLKQSFISKRKQFDKMVQKAKRSYWYKIQSDILNECCHGQS